MEERDWSSLPLDVLAAVLEQLRWSSHPSFALSCRHWRSAVPPFYPAWITPLLLSTARVGAANLRYYSPYYHYTFEVVVASCDDDVARDAKICCATGRHLALEKPRLALDVHLVTGAVRQAPHAAYADHFDFVVYGGSGARRMFGIDAVLPLAVGYTSQIGDGDEGEWEDWTLTEYDANGPRLRPSPVTNPVFHRGSIYLLGEHGRLAVYDPCKHAEGFKILDKPMSFGFEQYHDSYLVESDQGELMAVLFGRRGTPVHVIVLNKERMEWEQVESLQGRTLFTGTLTSMVKKTKFKWMQNRVFLPMFYKWPETIHVNIISRDGELAFVPKSSSSNTKYSTMGDHSNGTCCEKCADVWSYKLGQQETRENWGAERVYYGVWVDLH
ncbi:hypothetical protein OsI_31252 [Oryza sativa Indica Group]|nr:hypothetical protein OsI_31252 [Oryza sativa Indica Group]KAF2916034.1 hypothetical protein DAI22_09g087600 [Oryza sativa Japonica Group]USI00646.1 F-box domain-containing protein [Oryza sativa Japonica Group]BAD26535.1 hypothetical protein [Oryza sativa Japonica Group]